MINADIIIKLFTRFQLLTFWQNTFKYISGVSFVIGLLLVIICFFCYDDKNSIRTCKKLLLVSIFFFSSARAVLPLGLDALDTINTEIQTTLDAFWNFLTK